MIYKKRKVWRDNNTSVKCQRCYGTGKVIVVSLLNKLSGYKKIKCRRCGGTGINLK